MGTSTSSITTDSVSAGAVNWALSLYLYCSDVYIAQSYYMQRNIDLSLKNKVA